MAERSPSTVLGWNRSARGSACESGTHSGDVHRTHQRLEQKKASKKGRTDKFFRGTDPTANRDSGDKNAFKAPKRAIFTFQAEQIGGQSFMTRISITFRLGKLFLTSSLYSIY
jgi:hypothetical protein